MPSSARAVRNTDRADLTPVTPLQPVTVRRQDLKKRMPQASEPWLKELPKNFGSKPGENADAALNRMLWLFNEKKAGAQVALADLNITPERKNYHHDVIKALDGDIAEVKKGLGLKKNRDKVKLYNRMLKEYNLEMKFNVSLTSTKSPWSEKDMKALEEELGKLPEKLTRDDPNLHEIRINPDLPKGVGGYNHGSFIEILPDSPLTKPLLIHELGHNFDAENPRWNEFQQISGWVDVTGQFEAVSTDYIDEGKKYEPYKGNAELKRNGVTYIDNQTVDLDGDGNQDGVLQVHGDRVRVYKSGSAFISKYATTDPREDMAETFRAFFSGKAGAEELKKKCPEKFQFMVEFTGVDPTAVHSLLKI